ncbi:hypothetical protein TREPR_3380 [Treponema primitia ZAS-2]|uniref:Uncharacterized protein n=1 Tax=Treponema primitia (strain ATCC BAA-887 / DSM 12427 / ZAS-2) TaxID=545694 RepID=F5YJN1_TREPZ|nr:hypothetical protein TREPR_3380 [Treponema primitia ZAS-2]
MVLKFDYAAYRIYGNEEKFTLVPINFFKFLALSPTIAI